MMHYIAWIFFGLIVGLIARFLMPGSQSMGWILTIVLGIVGSFVGGFISSLFTSGDNITAHATGWIMSIIGAMLVLFLFSLISRRT